MPSYYDSDDEPRRRHSTRHAHRPVYEEKVFESRSRPSRQMDLVRRPRDDSTSSIEEVRVQRRVSKYVPRAQSVDRSRFYEDSYGHGRRSEATLVDDRRGSRRYEERTSRRSHRYESDSDSRSPPPRQRRKSLSEKALEAVGLGGAIGALTGHESKRDDRARSRSRRRGSRSRSRSRSQDKQKKIQQAVKAALTAGAVEAFRSRKEPGGWAGQGKRVMTAAIGAAGVNGAMNKDPDKHSTRHTIEAVVGGLAGNRLINGARENSRSRSRSRARGEEKSGPGLGGLAAAGGLAALAGKALNDYRNKQKEESSRGRRDSSYYDDSRSPSPQRKRSKSVTDYVTRGLDKGMAKLGFQDHREALDKTHHHFGYGDRHNDDYVARPRGGGGEEEDHKNKGSGTDDYSSEEEIRKQKKMRTKQMITAGLATVATIHAGHSVYQSMEKRKARKEKVLEGKMSPEEARKLKSKALLQDAASVGIAALGIKGAISEWKETKEKAHECSEAKHRLEEKREHRRLKREGKWPPGSSDGGDTGSNNGSSNGRNNRNSEPDLNRRYRDDAQVMYRNDYRNDYGPRYQDGNPYSAGLPPPPMGFAPIRY